MYRNDIVLLSENYNEWMAVMQQAFTLIRIADWYTHWRSTRFFVENISYLDHVVRPVQLELERTAGTAVQELNRYRSQTDLRSFFVFFTTSHCFIPNFSTVTAPLSL